MAAGIDPNWISKAHIFRHVEPDCIDLLVSKAHLIDVEKGSVLLSPAQENTFLYIVAEGALTVHLDDLSNPPLTRLLSGDCTGEMSVLERANPSAFVVAEAHSQLVSISYDVLWSAVGQSHALSRNLLVMLSSRVRSDNRNIVQAHAVVDQFKKRSMTDALTGLNNRHWLQDACETALTACQTANQSAAMMMLDVDAFAQLNNRYGHLAGDKALSTVAAMLKEELRDSDLAARFGGDEIVALLPQTGLEVACEVAERVRSAIGHRESIVDRKTYVTVSIGVAEMVQGDNLQTLLSRVDAALYRAKLGGRDQVST